MMAYENDVFTVPEALKKMSVSEIKHEKEKLLGKLKKSKSEKKPIKSNNSGILYRF